MVWNKTPQETVNKIVQALYVVDRSVQDIAEEFEVSAWLIGEISRANLSLETRKIRQSAGCRRSKVGVDNPMFGKKGELHHNSEKIVRKSGYKTTWVPEWFTGKGVYPNRIYEHIFVWCQNYSHSELPTGCVVHHIDQNIDNNSIDNLQLLGIGEHIKLHAEIRKVQRLEGNLVGSSTSEAQSNS